jgi:2-polyprenyl-3-methyl-5-hydroxy-6-metoxy-1,4-benzoquinol methylase
MSYSESTQNAAYTDRLISIQTSKVKRLFKFINPYRNNIRKVCSGRVLDVGCGIGRNLMYLGSSINVGVDHNENSIQFLNSKGYLGFTPKEFEENFPTNEETFDTILFSHVIEHLSRESAIEVVQHYSKWLKTNGLIVIICPQEKGFASDITHLSYFDERDIEKLLIASGFSGVRKKSFPFSRRFGRIWMYNEHVVTGLKQ